MLLWRSKGTVQVSFKLTIQAWQRPEHYNVICMYARAINPGELQGPHSPRFINIRSNPEPLELEAARPLDLRKEREADGFCVAEMDQVWRHTPSGTTRATGAIEYPHPARNQGALQQSLID